MGGEGTVRWNHLNCFFGHVFTALLTVTASILPAPKKMMWYSIISPFNFSQPFKQNITTNESCNHIRAISSGAHQTIKSLRPDRSQTLTQFTKYLIHISFPCVNTIWEFSYLHQIITSWYYLIQNPLRMIAVIKIDWVAGESMKSIFFQPNPAQTN